MALVNCPECGDRVSTLAPQCSNCGYALSEEATATDKNSRVVAARPRPVVPPVAGPQPRSQSNWVIGAIVVAGTATILAGIAAVVILAGSISVTNPFEASETTAAADQTTIVVADGNAYGLLVGECINDDELENYFAGADYSTTPCSGPHDSEVYFVYEYEAGPYPGEDAVSEKLVDICSDEFEQYVGRDYASSSLVIYRLWPGSDLWDSGGRIGECLLYDSDLNPLTGSAYQSGW